VRRRDFITLLGGAAAWPVAARAQQAARAQDDQARRVGVILPGGPWYAVVDGLREGLNQSGLIDGKRFILDIRDTGGDMKAAQEAARNLEQQNAELIYTAATSVSLAAKHATTKIPIVFFAGTDPVAVKLVESIRRPGGRLTGVHTPVTYVTGKRLELLREIVPSLRRVVTFYNPANSAALEFANAAREAARNLGVELLERHVSTVEALHKSLQAFRTGEADAYLAASDAMLDTEAPSIIAMTTAKRLPSMFYLQGVVADGGLASYSPDFKEGGRLSARYVRRVLEGANPGDLPVEQIDRLVFVINLNTAKRIGFLIPESILIRADKVIE
jgi:putative tryptophan/tyrosine transport system substrate-binding protein